MANVALYRRGKTWHLRARHGKRSLWSVTTGTDQLDQAQAILSSVQSELLKSTLADRIGLATFDPHSWRPKTTLPKSKQTEIHCPEALREYLRELERMHQSCLRSANSEKSRAVAIGQILGNIAVSKLGYKEARQVLASLRDQGYATKTQSEMLRVARGMGDFWRRMGWIETNPFKLDGIKSPRIQKPPRPFWNKSEIEEILAKSPEPLRAFWAVQAYAGLRISEAFALDVMDIDLKSKGIVVRNGKGGKTARVPIGPRLAELLTEQLSRIGTSPKVFPDLPGTPTNLGQVLNRICKGMEFEQGGKPHPHRFRHSFASNLARNGTDLVRIKELMRHEDIKQTARYAHLLPQDTQAAVSIF